MPFFDTLPRYNNPHKLPKGQEKSMFELIILVTFVLWCVFGTILLKLTGWSFKKMFVRRVEG